MTADQLRKFLRAQPFRPFAIHLADGTSLRVRHPELVLITPSGRTAGVAADPDAIEIISLPLVTKLSPLNGASRTSKRRRRRG